MSIVSVYVQMCRLHFISFLSQRIKSLSVKMAHVFKVEHNVVCILLGISPASDYGLPTFRNTLSVPSSKAGCEV